MVVFTGSTECWYFFVATSHTFNFGISLEHLLF